jgi:hypothetical protein
VTVRARRAGRPAGVLAAVLLGLLAGLVPAGEASAGGGLGGTPSGPPAPSDGPQTTTVRTCRLYAEPESFGLTCRHGTDGFDTIRQILGGDPLPDCWDDQLPPDLAIALAPEVAQNRDKGLKGDFYLHVCLKGVDPKTLKVEPGGIHYTQNPVWIEPPARPTTLTDRQRGLVATADQNQRIPLPVVATSPSTTPRVGQDVSFWVTNDRQTAPLVVAGPGVGRVVMRGRLVFLQVTPDPSQSAVGCRGAGLRADRADSPTSAPGACWWRYARSSATQPGQSQAVDGAVLPAYDVPTVATWVVEYDPGDGVWHTLATFERRQALEQPVTEIQTLVVPL